MGNNNQVLKYITNILKVLGALFCLYCFICSLDILSTAFKLLAGQATGKSLFQQKKNRFCSEITDISILFQETYLVEDG